MLNYVLALLAVLVFGLGAATYGYKAKADRLGDSVATLQGEVSQWKEKAQEAINREVVANTRCVASQVIVSDTNSVISTLEESKNVTLRELASQPHSKLLETIIDANTKTPTVADDARLSSDAMRMLNEAYCAGSNDPTCPASGATKTVRTSKGSGQ